MELGTTKELDTVGENAFTCANSLQRIDFFRSIILSCGHQVPKTQKPTRSFLCLRQTMTPPSLLVPPLPNTSSSCSFLAMHAPRIAFLPPGSYRIHRLPSPNDLIASIQFDLYRTPSLQRTNSGPYASFSMQDPVLDTLYRRRLKQFEKVRWGQVGY